MQGQGRLLDDTEPADPDLSEDASSSESEEEDDGLDWDGRPQSTAHNLEQSGRVSQDEGHIKREKEKEKEQQEREEDDEDGDSEVDDLLREWTNVLG